MAERKQYLPIINGNDGAQIDRAVEVKNVPAEGIDFSKIGGGEVNVYRISNLRYTGITTGASYSINKECYEEIRKGNVVRLRDDDSIIYNVQPQKYQFAVDGSYYAESNAFAFNGYDLKIINFGTAQSGENYTLSVKAVKYLQ